MSYDVVKREAEKMHTLDRIIVLRPMEGKHPTNSSGQIDKRLFSGDNKLHAVFDNQKGFWHMRYDNGSLPGALDVNFVELAPLLDFARSYFANRNIEIVEIQG